MSDVLPVNYKAVINEILNRDVENEMPFEAKARRHAVQACKKTYSRWWTKVFDRPRLPHPPRDTMFSLIIWQSEDVVAALRTPYNISIISEHVVLALY